MLNEAVGVVLEVVAVGIATVVDDDVAALLGGSGCGTEGWGGGWGMLYWPGIQCRCS